jgi:hypothetical protein
VLEHLMTAVALPRLQQFLHDCAEFDVAAPWDTARSRCVPYLFSLFDIFIPFLEIFMHILIGFCLALLTAHAARGAGSARPC